MTESKIRDGRRTRRGAALAGLIGVLAVLGPASVRADGTPWDKDHHWVSARAGVAKSGATLAPGGNMGFGVGYTWMLGNNLGWSATAGYDVLGKYGAAAEIELPVTTDFARHFSMGHAAKLYTGLGWGVIYHKTYRTGADEAQLLVATALAVGDDRAIGAARDAIGDERLGAVLPFLQAPVLEAETRRQMKTTGLDIDELRAATARALGIEEPKLEQIRRVTWGSLVTAALLAIGGYFLVSGLAGLGLDQILEELERASSGWIVVGLALVTGVWNDFVSWVRDVFVSDARLPI